MKKKQCWNFFCATQRFGGGDATEVGFQARRLIAVRSGLFLGGFGATGSPKPDFQEEKPVPGQI
jgi:hypothetical protein